MAKVILVAGPTASGKSAYALQLAKTQDGILLNADSLQVYRGLEILTAQPSSQEQGAIPHRLYGILDPSLSSSVGSWLSLVSSEIQQAHERGKVPIVVGGTGFYLKALFDGLSPFSPIAPQVREDLQKRGDSQGTLYKNLQAVDPSLATRLHPNDTQRILRGLEVFYGTGKPLSFWQSQKPSPPPYEFEKILLMPSKEDLQTRIQIRLDEMLEKGVLDEISTALSLPLSVTAKQAIGLKEFGLYLTGRSSLKDAKELTLLHTRQYAKRQRTWFRHQFQESLLLT